MPFQERINLSAGEQAGEWFLKINNKGEVPVLKIGDKFVSESDEIIALVDRTFSTGK